MKAAVYHEPNRMTVEDFPIPTAGPDDVVIKVHACGICGSDLHGYRAGLWVEPGEVMGHEWSGEVVEIGSHVDRLQKGDRITVGDGGETGGGGHKGVGYGLPGAYAEFTRIPNANSVKAVRVIPDAISYEEAAAMEPLRCGLHAARLANPREGDLAVVLGVGAIGLCTLQALKTEASCRTVAIDVSDRRLELASELGADFVFNAKSVDVLSKIKELTGEGSYRWGGQAAGRWSLGAQADIVIEAAGTAQTLLQALEMVKFGGTVVQVALFEKMVEFDPTIITQKQIRLQGSAGFGLAPFVNAAELVESGTVRLQPLVTHRFPLENIVEAFETQMNSAVSGKVIIVPDSVS